MRRVRGRGFHVALVAGVCVLAACAKQQSGPEQTAAPAIHVRVATLRYERLATPVEVSGSLAAVHSTTIGAATPGRIEAVNVREGDVVHAGDVIAQIDAAAYVANAVQARAGAVAAGASASAEASDVAAAAANAAGSQAQLDAASAREKLAQTTAARMSSLLAQGAISKQQDDETAATLASARASTVQAQAALEAARSTVIAARARLSAATASTQQAQAGVSAADVPLRNATVTAPFDGVVTKKFVEPGAVVAAGSPIATLQDDRLLEADVSVANSAVSALSPGDSVEVRIDAAGGAALRGHVRAIVASDDPTLRSATVKIDVPPAPGLLSGMYVRVRFTSRTRPVWVAPLAALVTRAGQSGVFVVRQGTATFTPVQTGTIGSTNVELVGYAGPAAEVAVSGIQRIDDGSPVTVER